MVKKLIVPLTIVLGVIVGLYYLVSPESKPAGTMDGDAKQHAESSSVTSNQGDEEVSVSPVVVSSSKEKVDLHQTPEFKEYAETANLYERFEGLKVSMNFALGAVVSQMNLESHEKEELRAKIEKLIQSNSLKEHLLNAMNEDFTEQEIMTLAEMYRNQDMMQVTNREQELLEQGPELMEKFISQYSDVNVMDSLRKVAGQRVEELGLWDDAQQIYGGMMSSLANSMDLEKHHVSRETFHQVSKLMMDAQKDSFDLGVMYLYQDLGPDAWPKFVAKYQSKEMTKERKLVHSVLGRFMEDVASAMGSYTAQVASQRG
ncbi:hypothetical protein [Pseudobacteriovorax antillogorgiicola]|uniref:DUF2059 domain-containing protein n=1 Tax=Pseudobacteriovorax antillogorgiicola TaxID=1513793 RepID=A0A1Y6CK64_9BACT|nr:hypothetical protein [Pseudobacteriovorax antillogorgiicola]TCS45931.1 hypothetical protein EDD56_12694 [Pseudobacteriovorax antillogorgiicola]SMF71001.1 hypothetical protein SAMN06296036_1264 [Pseudobacteriovorax antillogorgiicola]